MNSFFWDRRNPAFSGLIQGLSGPPNHLDREPHIQSRISCIGYSAAATSFGLRFADDIMKSEIRGTISDLKREPLKTP